MQMTVLTGIPSIFGRLNQHIIIVVVRLSYTPCGTDSGWLYLTGLGILIEGSGLNAKAMSDHLVAHG